MFRFNTNKITLLLAICGGVVSSVLLFKYLHPNADVECSSFGDGCIRLLTSDAATFGKVPLALAGLCMYLTLFWLCWERRVFLGSGRGYGSGFGKGSPIVPAASQAATHSWVWRKQLIRPLIHHLDFALCGIASAGMAISWRLQYIALYTILSVCLWCLVSTFLITTICLLSWYDLLMRYRRPTSRESMMIGVVGFICAMFLLLFVPNVLEQIDILAYPGHRGPTCGGRTPNHQGGTPEIKSKDMMTIGSSKAPVTIVEFTDYQCEHCKQSSEVMREALRAHPEKFRLAIRHFPLPMHPWARQAAIAAEAAGCQGKFWKMQNYLFAHQDDMERESFHVSTFSAYAKVIGLDVARFEADERSDKIASKINRDIAVAEADSLVTQLPTYFIYSATTDDVDSVRRGAAKSKQEENPPWIVTGVHDMKEALADPSNKVWQ